MKLLEVRITWLRRSYDVIMGRKLMFGAQELFFISYSVEFLHFGQVKVVLSCIYIELISVFGLGGGTIMEA